MQDIELRTARVSFDLKKFSFSYSNSSWGGPSGPSKESMRRAVLALALLPLPNRALRTEIMPQIARITRSSLSAVDVRLATAHEQAQAVPCPFFRRRFTDTVESAQLVMRWVHARHKSLPIEQPAIPLPFAGDKLEHLALTALADVLREDFGRHAYVNGRLTRAVYDDDCLFDGPDPDMPVRGVRKYCLAVSGLFDVRRSECRLLGEPLVDERARTIRCHWRLSGRLRLPWKPEFKPYLGCTTYHIDPNTGLISKALEKWSIHPFIAFLSVVLPRLADRLAADAPDVHSLDEYLAAWPAASETQR